jgi:hypothetical protein
VTGSETDLVPLRGAVRAGSGGDGWQPRTDIETGGDVALKLKKIYFGMVGMVFGFIHARRFARTDSTPYVLRASVDQTEVG